MSNAYEAFLYGFSAVDDSSDYVIV